jgi:hypothetical protein
MMLIRCFAYGGLLALALTPSDASPLKGGSIEKVRPEKIYAFSVADLQEFPKYEKIWKDIFQLR